MEIDSLLHKWKDHLSLENIDSVLDEDNEELRGFQALLYLLSIEYKNIKGTLVKLKRNEEKPPSIVIKDENINNSCEDFQHSQDIFNFTPVQDLSMISTPNDSDILVEESFIDMNIVESPTIAKKSKRMLNASKVKSKLKFESNEATLTCSSKQLNVAIKENLNFNESSIIANTPVLSLSKKGKYLKKSSSKKTTKLLDNNTLTQMFKVDPDPSVCKRVLCNSSLDETLFIPESKKPSPKLATIKNATFTEKRNQSILNPFPNASKDDDLLFAPKVTENSAATREKDYNDSYNIIPERYKPKSPEYAYKSGPVRKKSEKLKLKGWDCEKCEEYYKTRTDLTPEELQKLKNKCSKHRSKFNPISNTPKGFWDIGFSSQCSENSMMNFNPNK